MGRVLTNEEKLSLQAAVSLSLALLIQFPGTSGRYAPLGIVFWSLATEDVGEGERFYWLLVAVVVLAVYSSILFLIIWGLRIILRRLRMMMARIH